MSKSCGQRPSGPVRLLAVSDEVDERIYSATIRERFGDVDLVVGCGDLPFDYLEFIVTMLDVPVFYVHGNHDHTRVLREGGWDERSGPGGCISLEGRVVHCRGLLMAGLGGSMRYRADGAFQYCDREMTARVRRLAPRLWWNRWRHGRAVDILVTHAPPCGIHDGQDLCHTGFESFGRFLARYQPRYHIHGHVRPGGLDPIETQVGPTTVVNAHGFQVLTIDLPSAGGTRG
ncbi:MAG: metallophosphoesterase [Chloroflexi bacterium]|nr:metallophosphoesterase [Chloroflexota bacterium]